MLWLGNLYKKYVLGIIFVILVSLGQAADYRNFYGINWRGSACDNIDYAKSMGYDFVLYQSGMQRCINSNDLGFYIPSPDNRGFPNGLTKIDFLEAYPADDIAKYNDFFLWKSDEQFPLNLATGWYFDSHSFRPLPDFQRQEIIDVVVRSALSQIPTLENRSKNFYFAGYSFDVPTLHGDLWSNFIGLGGKQTTIRFWTGKNSGILHPGKTYQHAKYTDGQAAFKKKLFNLTRAKYPQMKVILEPNLPYEDYISDLEGRTDRWKLAPDMLCEEETDFVRFNNTLKFVYDQRIFSTGLITRDKMCSSTPKAFDHEINLKIAGNAAINFAWFAWHGRFGGGGNMPDYQSIRDVPARLKLMRAMVGWDNLNKAWSRSWDNNKLQYSSSHSYADKYSIYSRHPKNRMIYAVILNSDIGRIRLNSYDNIKAIYNADSLFRKTSLASSDFVSFTSGGYTRLYLKDGSNQGRGYIIELGP